MISSKEAANKARDYLVDLLAVDAKRVVLEEVELIENDSVWLITLSFPGPDWSPVWPELVTAPARKYKEFRVAADTGAVKAMKMR